MTFYVYILSNRWRTVFYTGQTNNIKRRIFLHRVKFYRRAFTAKYNCDDLMYYEERLSRRDGLSREREIKKFRREWKFQMISRLNPRWKDLSEKWNLSEFANYYKKSEHLHRR